MNVRCFVGVDLPLALRQGLVDAGAAIRNSDSHWADEKWVAEENLHLTLAFIGSVDEDELRALRAVVGSTATAHPRFTVPFRGLRATPSAHRCRMVWAEFDDAEGACARLAGALVAATAPFGTTPERRGFTPHITLCRARRPKPLAQGAVDAGSVALNDAPDSMSVLQATLFTSRLTPRGPVYARVDAWRLWGD